jgi:hypothetical protein
LVFFEKNSGELKFGIEVSFFEKSSFFGSIFSVFSDFSIEFIFSVFFSVFVSTFFSFLISLFPSTFFTSTFSDLSFLLRSGGAEKVLVIGSSIIGFIFLGISSFFFSSFFSDLISSSTFVSFF